MSEFLSECESVIMNESNFVGYIINNSSSPSRLELKVLLGILNLSVEKGINLQILNSSLMNHSFKNEFEFKNELFERLSDIAEEYHSTLDTMISNTVNFAKRYPLTDSRFNYDYLNNKLDYFASTYALEDIAYTIVHLIPSLPSLALHEADRIARSFGAFYVSMKESDYSPLVLERISKTLLSNKELRGLLDDILWCDIYTMLTCICIIGSKVRKISEKV